MYDFKSVEKKWREYWKENDIYKFDKEKDEKIYQLETIRYRMRGHVIKE